MTNKESLISNFSTFMHPFEKITTKVNFKLQPNHMNYLVDKDFGQFIQQYRSKYCLNSIEKFNFKQSNFLLKDFETDWTLIKNIPNQDLICHLCFYLPVLSQSIPIPLGERVYCEFSIKCAKLQYLLFNQREIIQNLEVTKNLDLFNFQKKIYSCLKEFLIRRQNVYVKNQNWFNIDSIYSKYIIDELLLSKRKNQLVLSKNKNNLLTKADVFKKFNLYYYRNNVYHLISSTEQIFYKYESKYKTLIERNVFL